MKNKPKLKVNFTDFWPDFNLPNFMLYQFLTAKYSVSISEQPDILFYSVYGNKHCKYACTKIFFTPENERPDFYACDYAFSFDFHSNKRNYRLPLYAFYGDINNHIHQRKNPREILQKKKKFCCFIVSNPVSDIRNNFFLELSKVKNVDSGGSLFNNIGRLVQNKREFIRDYKFVIAFENSSFPGYVTEKIFEPLMENCIPIYWGSPLVKKDFNTKSFINTHDFPSFSEVIRHIMEVDNDDEKYIQYLNEPIFNNNEPYKYAKKENILKRLDEIILFNGTRNTVTRSMQIIRPLYCFMKSISNKIKTRISFFPQLSGSV